MGSGEEGLALERLPGVKQRAGTQAEQAAIPDSSPRTPMYPRARVANDHPVCQAKMFPVLAAAGLR